LNRTVPNRTWAVDFRIKGKRLQTQRIHQLARDCGFRLAGVAPAAPVADFNRYRSWIDKGFAASMSYLSGHRATVRNSPTNLLPSARTVICVGKLYNTPYPKSIQNTAGDTQGWISRYAWGRDYHQLLRKGLESLRDAIAREAGEFDSRICVDTAPLLERSLARLAGLGWIGKNTCLIHEGAGSWFFLGELITSLELEPDSPPPDRCGTCTRCIDACPTNAIVPGGGGSWTVDSNLCISHHTIELRGPIEESARSSIGNHLFGCDICQDVCPWNRRAPLDADPAFLPREGNLCPDLAALATLSENEFRDRFAGTSVIRARYQGFLRNVAIVVGNSGNRQFRPLLEKLAAGGDPVVSAHARWALERLTTGTANRHRANVLRPQSR
jgi:epoxyqueuosine reductase